MMRSVSKERISSCCPKANTGVTHVCPSKLSKRELEDLYFTLAQKNLELKHTINELSEKIKYQTTKLQRMLSTQQAYMGSEPRDCCATAKSIVQEQKQVIIELKNANIDLQEQINSLNMKLCTTKQFLPRGTAKNTPRNKKQTTKSPVRSQAKQKASPRSPTIVKNASTSVFREKRAEEGVQSTEMKSVSCQCLDPENRNKLCDQNKCKTQMDEMQQKILNLQEELAKTHQEYSNRIARLEREVIELHSENLHVLSEKAMFEKNMLAQSNDAGDIKKKLAESECQCEKLSADLSIEKGKVAELQTQVKAANMTGSAVKALEDRLNKENTTTSRRGSISSARSTVINSPNANLLNESKFTEDKNLQGEISPNKNGTYNSNVNPENKNRNIQKQNSYSGESKFPDIGMFTNYVKADEENFKFDDLCNCPDSSENVTNNKVPTSEEQQKPLSFYETAQKFVDDAYQKYQGNSNSPPGDTVKLSDTSCQQPNRQTDVAPHDKTNFSEGTDQNVVKYRDTLSSRLRYNHHPTGDSSKHSYALDTKRIDENTPKGQDITNGSNYDVSRDVNKLGESESIKAKNENNRLRSVTERGVVDKNKESGADKCLKPGDDKVDYTTEYRSQYNYHPRYSPDFRISSQEPIEQSSSPKSPPEPKTLYGTDVIPEIGKKRMSPEPGKRSPLQQTQILEPLSDQAKNTESPSQQSQTTSMTACCHSVQTPSVQQRETSDKSAATSTGKTADESGFIEPNAYYAATNDARRMLPEPGKGSPLQQTQSLEPLSDQAKNTESPSQQSQTTLMPACSHSVQTPSVQQRETSDKSAETSTGKTADDSGFIEPNAHHAATTDGRALLRENEELEKRVSKMQAQLEELKNHVLLRKDTYTVFKDEATTSDAPKQKPDSGIQATIIPMDTSAQTGDVQNIKVDPRRVMLKTPRRGYITQESQPEDRKEEAGRIERTTVTRPKYNYPDHSNVVPNCKSTCQKEGLLCTKECQNENKVKDLNQPDRNYKNRRNDDDIRYQSPGPASAYSPDESGTRRVHDHSNLQPTELSTSGAWRTGNGTNTSTDPNFFGASNSKNPHYSRYAKEESPPTNLTQYIDNSSKVPVPKNQEAYQNAQYAKKTAFNSQYGKNDNVTQLKPLNAGTAYYTKDQNPLHMETLNTVLHQENGDNCSCARCQMLQEIIVKSKNSDLKHVNGKNTSVKSVSKASKKIPVKCMCPRNSEYTTNILHTATGPIIVPNIGHITGYNDSFYATRNEKCNLFLYQDTMQRLVSATEEGHKQINILNKDKTTKDKSLNQNLEPVKKLNDVCENNSSNNANYNESLCTKNESDFNPKNEDEHLHQTRSTSFVDSYGNVRSLNNDTGKLQKDAAFQQKYGHETGFTDMNSRESQFIENSAGTKLNNLNETMPISRLSEINADLNTPMKPDEFASNMQQPQSLPVATSSPFAHVSDKLTQNHKTDKKTGNNLDTSESHTQTYTCPKTACRDVSVFRSSSGTLRFETISNSCESRKCNYPNPCPSDVHETQQDSSCSNFKKEPNTYTIESSADKVDDNAPKQEVLKYSRATSPENTDQEISSLTDLPSEKETSTTPREKLACRKCARYSPGEDKSTTAKSETVTSQTSSSKPLSYPLSDGEMPQYFDGSPKAQVDSFYIEPQRPDKERIKVDKSTLKVEQALASISEELARCRELLEKPKETIPLKKEREKTIRLKDIAEYELSDDKRPSFEGKGNRRESPKSPNNPGRSAFALHHAEAKPHIGHGPNKPHVIFTLHIGTIVLSDEALIKSRNLSFVLTWKFYDQNAAMSHMKPGRVIHFDFSTEYDVNLTDHFLYYMRTEELQISVCELNKLNSPYAYCLMPLREALLHTNRRADMSLTLVAGPQMRRSCATDNLDNRDELGVLDLWCMLRTEPCNFPRISIAIAQSKPSGINGYRTAQQNYADSTVNHLNIPDDRDGRDPADLDQVFQQPIRLQARDSKDIIQPGLQKEWSRTLPQDHGRLSNDGYNTEARSKSMGKLNFTSEGKEKFPGLHNVRKSSLKLSQEVNNSSLNMIPPVQSENRNWKKDNDQVLKKLSNMDIVKNYRRKSNDSGLYTTTDVPDRQTSRFDGTKRAMEAYKLGRNKRKRDKISERIDDEMLNFQIDNKNEESLTIDITILWLALNEECPAMTERSVQKLYVAYSFLGRSGAELETPESLPKPRQYQDKCYFNFKKSFHLTNADLVALGRLARYRTPHKGLPNPKESVVFTVVSEPVEDPLGLNNCEDIGYAYLYFGDLIAFSADSDTYTEVIPIHGSQSHDCICGVLSIRVDGLNVVRKCLTIS